MNGDREPASTEMERLLGWIAYHRARLEERVSDHDLDGIKSEFSDLEDRVKRFSRLLKECDQRIDYGEEWDQ